MYVDVFDHLYVITARSDKTEIFTSHAEVRYDRGHEKQDKC